MPHKYDSQNDSLLYYQTTYWHHNTLYWFHQSSKWEHKPLVLYLLSVRDTALIPRAYNVKLCYLLLACLSPYFKETLTFTSSLIIAILSLWRLELRLLISSRLISSQFTPRLILRHFNDATLKKYAAHCQIATTIISKFAKFDCDIALPTLFTGTYSVRFPCRHAPTGPRLLTVYHIYISHGHELNDNDYLRSLYIIFLYARFAAVLWLALAWVLLPEIFWLSAISHTGRIYRRRAEGPARRD